jgi:predicted transcriptional regulator
MEKTLTIRLAREQDEALTKRAQILGRTRSALVRELLAKALAEEPLSARAAHLKGTLLLKRPTSAWGKKLRERNWR